MKRFAFSLEPLLDRRRHNEACAQQAFARSRASLEAACAEGERLNAVLQQCAAFLRAGHPSVANDGWREHRARLEHLERALPEIDERIAQCEADAERACCALRVARQHREVLETLREKRFVQHRLEGAARDQREIDDANVGRQRGAARRSGCPYSGKSRGDEADESARRRGCSGGVCFHEPHDCG